jgi:hypothetical protein
VQLRFETGLTGADYVIREGWRLASLAHCPAHPQGGCDFARHGTYERLSPRGTRIARWYCPQAHCTFSLLPDHLAARFAGTLYEIEQVVATAEQARSVEAAADRLRRDDITLPSAVRWVRRRVAAVRALLTIVIGLFPQLLLGCAPTLTALRERFACDEALMMLREVAAPHLQALAPPLGLKPRSCRSAEGDHRFQQYMGADPPQERA